jgi:hypothetical protein
VCSTWCPIARPAAVTDQASAGGDCRGWFAWMRRARPSVGMTERGPWCRSQMWVSIFGVLGGGRSRSPERSRRTAVRLMRVGLWAAGPPASTRRSTSEGTKPSGRSTR